MPPAKPPALPVVPREYHEFDRAPRWRWWRGLAALALFAVFWGVAAIVVSIVQLVVSLLLGSPVPASVDDATVTPELFLANNVMIAAALPAAMLAHWIATGQRPRWLSSVVGGLRWGWLLTCVGICLLPWLALTAWETLSGDMELTLQPHTWLLIVGIVLTTPLQAAGEEYMVRGLLPRVIGGWIPHRTIGLMVGAVVSAGVFMSLHMAADPYLNAFYFTFGLLASFIVWRTGGLEATIAIHVVNNMVAEWTLPFSDISGVFDRSAGVGDWTVVLPLLCVVVAGAVMELLARRRHLVRAAAPGASIPPAIAAGSAPTSGPTWTA